MTSQRTPGNRSPFVGVAYKGLAAVLLAVAVSAASCGQQTTLPPPTSPSPPTSATPTPPVASADVPHDRNDALAIKALREASVRQERFETLRRNLVLALPFDRAKTFPGFPLPRACSPAAAIGTIDPHRSLFVHDLATLTGADFSLRRTLGLLAIQIGDAGVAGVSAESLFRDIWDTQNPASAAANPSGAHCDDDASTINGFPNSCPRNEGAEATAVASNPALLEQYAPVALVNRLDLAHEGWRNCGEHRIIYAKSGSGGRNLLIFEAVLPNPSPGCKDACRPVAEFWANLSTLASATDRAQRLEDFFFGDLPADANNFSLPGFRPVVHVQHYSATGPSTGYGTAGGGQIRTNQFLSGTNRSVWTLKELRTQIDCDGPSCEFEIVPDTVKLNPFAQLWSPDRPGSDFAGRVAGFQAEIALQVAALGAGSSAADLNYTISGVFNGAQSNSQEGNAPLSSLPPSTVGDSAYCSAFGCNTGAHYLEASLATFNGTRPPDQQLTAEQIVNRATALSCGGCHMPSSFGLTGANKLGPSGVSLTQWPAPAGAFVHVDDRQQVPMPIPANFGGQPGFAISDALSNHFLPARETVLREFLEEDDCVCLPRFTRQLPLAARRRLVPPQPRVPTLLKTPTDSVRLHQEDAKLLVLAQREAQAAGLKVPQAVPEARPSLGVTKGIPNRADRHKARVKAVLKLVETTPPRRTVTGSFRAH